MKNREAIYDQPPLPFLTPDQAATLEGARAAIERAQQKAWMARRNAEADELGRIGDELIAMLEANATAIRRTRHPSVPATFARLAAEDEAPPPR